MEIEELLAPFEQELAWMIDGDSREKRYLDAIARKDYIEASLDQHQMMVLQRHRSFVPRLRSAIAENKLDKLMADLLEFIMTPSVQFYDHPSPYEMAKLDAARVHWKLVTRIVESRGKQ